MLQSMRSAAKYIWWFLVLAFVGGFLLYSTSGLGERGAVTTTTSVGEVNGEEIMLTAWQNAVSQLEQQESQRLGRTVSLDERRTLEDQAFNELVNEILLRQEYKRRGITVSDEEVQQAALVAPPPTVTQAAAFQTDGRFDMAKYRRYLGTAEARQGGVLAGLEQYYRAEIPKQKLYDQVAADVYITDERAWQIYRDRYDSAQVSYVVLRTENLTDTAVSVTDDEISRYYDANKKRYERPGRAVVSVLTIPRAMNATDSAGVKSRADRVRAEIVAGGSFDEIAKRESSDSGSAVNGGLLPKGPISSYVTPFANAVRALKPGEVSQPVETQFGWHIVRVESKTAGDTAEVRHILIPFAQSDSSASRTDRRADSLGTLAGNSDDPKKFDAAAKTLALTPQRAIAFEREELTVAGRYVPSVSAWAFSGVNAGETSELFDSPDAYYLARLDSLTKGGQQALADVRGEIRDQLAADKRIEKLRPIAAQLRDAAKASSLESAAGQKNLTVGTSNTFTRGDVVPGLGQFSEAIGSAFAIPVGQVGGPARAAEGLVVMRVNRRVDASRDAFAAAKSDLKVQLTNAMRQQRIEQYLGGLRDTGKVEDRRSEVQAALRRQSTGT